MKNTITIAQLGEPVLRLSAKEVDFTKDGGLYEIIEKMKSQLKGTNGLGIAAPQVFESIRVVVIASHPSERYPFAPKMQAVVMINPSFTICSTKTTKDWEGCLSIPGIRAMVPRYENIIIKYTDPQGGQQELVADGFIARIFQHEYDHLNGMVYLDRVEDNKDIISESEFQKLMGIVERT